MASTLYTQPIPVRLTIAQRAEMTAVLAPTETPSDFIRSGVQLEITARQAAQSLHPISVRMHAAQLRVHAYLMAERAAGRDVPLDDDGVRTLLAVAWPGIEAERETGAADA